MCLSVGRSVCPRLQSATYVRASKSLAQRAQRALLLRRHLQCLVLANASGTVLEMAPLAQKVAAAAEAAERSGATTLLSTTFELRQEGCARVAVTTRSPAAEVRQLPHTGGRGGTSSRFIQSYPLALCLLCFPLRRQDAAVVRARREIRSWTRRKLFECTWASGKVPPTTSS